MQLIHFDMNYQYAKYTRIKLNMQVLKFKPPISKQYYMNYSFFVRFTSCKMKVYPMVMSMQKNMEPSSCD